MGNRVIENYEPDDKGRGIVVGRLRPKPESKPPEKLERDEDAPADEDTE